MALSVEKKGSGMALSVEKRGLGPEDPDSYIYLLNVCTRPALPWATLPDLETLPCSL